jgi:predicted small secreted protein
MSNLRGPPACLIVLLAAPALSALPGCATVAGAGEAVWIGVDGDNDCRIDADGRAFALPADEARLAERLRRLARRSPSALIGPPPARTSPGCWDRAVDMVRAAGFARIGFFSNEEPDDERTG